MRNGIKNGFGLFKDEVGNSYVGEWKDNMQHGQGKLITTNGGYQGTFNNNNRTGKFIYDFTDGK